MNKKKIIIAIIVVGVLFATTLIFSRQKPAVVQDAQKPAVNVSVQSFDESKKLSAKNEFPAIIVSDQEVKVTAKSAGTITVAPGNVGDRVGRGSLLALIDDAGTLASGSQGLQSLQVQQSELSLLQAKKSYTLAKDTYDKIKKSSSATSIEKKSAQTQRDIAKIQYDNARLGLTGAVDNHKIQSPLSGIIVSKAVSRGDSVSIGQLIAVISQNSNMKVQFFVDENERTTLARGQEISALTSDGTTVSFVIRNIAGAADPTTKRFLIEAYPKKQDSKLFLSGTIITVSLETTLTPKASTNILLPLSALTVGQNSSSIFIVENNQAKKVPVTIVSVSGEIAEISAPLGEEALIITEGNKLVSDGETVIIHTR